MRFLRQKTIGTAVAISLGLWGGISFANAATIADSTFDTDSDGWGLFNAHPLAILTWSPTGGNPGGNISINGGTGVWYFSAPGKFLGDVSSSYQQALTFDLRAGVGIQTTTNRSVLLEGGGLSLEFGTPIPNNSFANYVVPFDETEGTWRIAGTSNTPTGLQMLTVLSSLDAIYIPGAFLLNPDPGGTSWLDNVALNAIPLPAALPLMGTGLAVLGFLGWRRRRAA